MNRYGILPKLCTHVSPPLSMLHVLLSHIPLLHHANNFEKSRLQLWSSSLCLSVFPILPLLPSLQVKVFSSVPYSYIFSIHEGRREGGQICSHVNKHVKLRKPISLVYFF
jgi:hypothetical protein